MTIIKLSFDIYIKLLVFCFHAWFFNGFNPFVFNPASIFWILAV